LNWLWMTAGMSSGADAGNFCRTANMRGNESDEVIALSGRDDV